MLMKPKSLSSPPSGLSVFLSLPAGGEFPEKEIPSWGMAGVLEKSWRLEPGSLGCREGWRQAGRGLGYHAVSLSPVWLEG